MDNLSLMTLGVEVDKIAEQISKFQQYEDFVSSGMQARLYRDKSQWILGCLARGVEMKYGEQSLAKYAKEIGIRVTNLNTYRWVAKQFLDVNPSFVPPERVPFGALHAIASLPPEAREKLLEEAEVDGMSVERARIKASEAKGRPIKPKFTLEYCADHKKWMFVPVNIEDWEPFH